MSDIPESTIEAMATIIEDMELRFPEKTIAKVALQAALSEGGVVLASSNEIAAIFDVEIAEAEFNQEPSYYVDWLRRLKKRVIETL